MTFKFVKWSIYQSLLNRCLEMPQMSCWEFGKDGFTRYRYMGGKLETKSEKDTEWAEILSLPPPNELAKIL